MNNKKLFLVKCIFLTVYTFTLISCKQLVRGTTPYPEVYQRNLKILPTENNFYDLWNSKPHAGKAIIKGTLKVTRDDILIGELYLSKAVPTSQEGILLIELDQNSDPRAYIDRQELKFIFTNIDPGVYGIVTWEPLSSFPLSDPRTGDTLFIHVTENSIIDLGVLYIP